MAKKKKAATAEKALPPRRLTCAIDPILFSRLGAFARFSERRIADVVAEALIAHLAAVRFTIYVGSSGAPPALTTGPEAIAEDEPTRMVG